MSIASVRTYARARLDALDFEEWSDGFNFENVPRTMQGRVYLLELGDISANRHNQDNVHLLVPLTVYLSIAATRKPVDLIDEAAGTLDTLISSFLSAENRTESSGIWNVNLRSARIEPLADSNDNGVRIIVSFDMLVISGTR